jgi:pimeloyl-ACP methyl ester carboxylesterase
MRSPCQRVYLADGRALSFTGYGADSGQPAIYCHGWPSSRLEAAFLHDAALSAGLRLIAIDRPGFGDSSHQPRRRLIDWPADVAAFADALGLATWRMIGVSGGAPYALSCARALPDRVLGVAIIGGLGPLTGPAVEGMSAARVALLRNGLQQPWLLAGELSALRLWLQWHPTSFIRRFARGYPPRDQSLVLQPQYQVQWRAMVLEAFRHGARGPVHDAALLSGEWGFALEDIRCRVELWHGTRDTIVPVGFGHLLAAAMPNCRARFLADDGHFSPIIRRGGDILAALAASDDGSRSSAP